MGHLTSSRRTALEGLLRILDTSAPEELFVGPEDDAAFLYGLLTDVARARRSSHYWEICRTARRLRAVLAARARPVRAGGAPRRRPGPGCPRGAPHAPGGARARCARGDRARAGARHRGRRPPRRHAAGPRAARRDRGGARRR